jgi:hypothetical protein
MINQLLLVKEQLLLYLAVDCSADTWDVAAPRPVEEPPAPPKPVKQEMSLQDQLRAKMANRKGPGSGMLRF